jgi:hypothetical protein
MSTQLANLTRCIYAIGIPTEDFLIVLMLCLPHWSLTPAYLSVDTPLKWRFTALHLSLLSPHKESPHYDSTLHNLYHHNFADSSLILTQIKIPL